MVERKTRQACVYADFINVMFSGLDGNSFAKFAYAQMISSNRLIYIPSTLCWMWGWKLKFLETLPPDYAKSSIFLIRRIFL